MKKGDEITAWKVVGKRNRECSNVILFFNPTKTWGSSKIKTAKKYINENPKLFPVYTKGIKLKALVESEGLFVFRTREWARKFRRDYKITKFSKIIKVKGIVKYVQPKVTSGCGDHLYRVGSKIKFTWNHPVFPNSVITLSELEVLT